MCHSKEEAYRRYWTDGNDVEDTGVWTHAYDNSDVTFLAEELVVPVVPRHVLRVAMRSFSKLVSINIQEETTVTSILLK